MLQCLAARSVGHPLCRDFCQTIAARPAASAAWGAGLCRGQDPTPARDQVYDALLNLVTMVGWWLCGCAVVRGGVLHFRRRRVRGRTANFHCVGSEWARHRGTLFCNTSVVAANNTKLEVLLLTTAVCCCLLRSFAALNEVPV